MIELIFYWWLLPASAVLIVLRLMMWSDETTLDDVSPEALTIMLIMTVVWPIGVIFLIGMFIEQGIRRWRDE